MNPPRAKFVFVAMICMAVKISALRYLIANYCRAVMLTFYFYAMEPERSFMDGFPAR